MYPLKPALICPHIRSAKYHQAQSFSIEPGISPEHLGLWPHTNKNIHISVFCSIWFGALLSTALLIPDSMLREYSWHFLSEGLSDGVSGIELVMQFKHNISYIIFLVPEISIRNQSTCLGRNARQCLRTFPLFYMVRVQKSQCEKIFFFFAY